MVSIEEWEKTMTKPRKGANQIRVMSDEEWYEMVNKLTRRYHNMSVEEFIEAWKSGEFDDNPDRYEVVHIVMLLPEVRDGRKESGRSGK
jgi:hypothetical protein